MAQKDVHTSVRRVRKAKGLPERENVDSAWLFENGDVQAFDI
jgi:hypothetical protein